MHMRHLSFVCAVAAVAMVAACSTTPDSGGMQSGAAGSAHGEPARPAVPGSEADLQTNVGDRIFFDKDSSLIAAEALKTLERQAQWLTKYPNVKVTIEGHCDERGTRDYNLALGYRRAHEVKEVLVAHGIDAARITTISYGKERPAVVGSDEAAWAQNRRAVTVVD